MFEQGDSGQQIAGEHDDCSDTAALPHPYAAKHEEHDVCNAKNVDTGYQIENQSERSDDYAKPETLASDLVDIHFRADRRP